MSTRLDGPFVEAAAIPRQRWRVLALLAIGLMLAMTTWFSTSAVLPTLRERWVLSTNEASLLVVVLQIGFVAGAVVSAVAGVADRWELRWVRHRRSTGRARSRRDAIEIWFAC